MSLLEFNKHVILKNYPEKCYTSGYLLHLSPQDMFQESNFSLDSALNITGF